MLINKNKNMLKAGAAGAPSRSRVNGQCPDFRGILFIYDREVY